MFKMINLTFFFYVYIFKINDKYLVIGVIVLVLGCQQFMVASPWKNNKN